MKSSEFYHFHSNIVLGMQKVIPVDFHGMSLNPSPGRYVQRILCDKPVSTFTIGIASIEYFMRVFFLSQNVVLFLSK